MRALKTFFWLAVIGLALRVVGAVASVLPYLLGVAVIIFILWACLRDRTPLTAEQKAALAAQADEQRERQHHREAEQFVGHYYKTIKRIPRSKWRMMTRYEKSQADEAREQLGFRFDELPERVRELVVEKYRIDPAHLRREV